MTDEPTSYFVGLHKPGSMRKDLLEGAKISVNILKSQYRVRSLRARKVELLSTLASMTRELSTLVGSIQMDMPDQQPDKMPKVVRELQQRRAKAAAKEMAAKRAAAKKASKKPSKKSAKKTPKKAAPKPTPKPAPRPVDDMAHLEQKLADIEKKLNKL